MSMFSYISFPVKVDKNCLKSSFDKSKAFTVAELKKTALANQFEQNLKRLPDELNVYLGDFSDLQGISIFDTDGESFNNVFENKYVYCFEASFKTAKKHNSRIYGRVYEQKEKQSQQDAFIAKIFGNAQDHDMLCRKQLYDIIQLNLRIGEKIEIYSEHISGMICSHDFGPFEQKIILESKQILISEQLRLEDKVKIEIVRTT